ncbi:MAG TPA: ComF family protein [Thermoanaerobaculia bacterium]|nr:ComF family protein [Thermoanaerobaculia bacterium]
MPHDPLYGPGPARVARSAKTWLGGLLHLLLPAPCLGCGEPLLASAPLGLCAPCRGKLAPLGRTACAVCAGPLDAFDPPPGYCCGACREEPPAFDRLLALWVYRPPLDAVVQGLKFRRLDYLGRHLANALADGLGEALDGFDGVVPVPLHWRRRFTRGYNQAERIACPLAGRLGLPLVPVLRRSRPTPPQTSLGKAGRLANLRRAFRVPRPEKIRGLRLLLVDDVATTGATLDAAAGVLRRAGAAGVTAVVAARTPAFR